MDTNICAKHLLCFLSERERQRQREIENSIYTNATWRSNYLGRGYA